MEIWGKGEHCMCRVTDAKGWTDLPGIETSVEGLVALWVDVSFISDDDARRAGGSLLDVGQLHVWSGHCGNRGRRRGRGKWKHVAYPHFIPRVPGRTKRREADVK